MDNNFSTISQEEILKKGFSVYDYISLDELLMTVRKDYLDILSKINIPFGILSIILGVISYASGFTLLIGFLLISYFIIFCILFSRLVLKTYYFLLLKNVVLTSKGVILGKELYPFGDKEKLQERLLKYEKIFLEYLGGKSRLEEYVNSKKKNIVSLSKNTKSLSKVSDFLRRNSLGRNNDVGKILIPAMISMLMYIVFMYVFYYLGYFFGLVMTQIYSVFIKGFLFFKGNIEYKIKNKTEKIDENLKKMNRVYLLLDSKFGEFRDGNISDIAKFTKQNFDTFYTEIFSIYKDKETLEKLIEKGGFKDFIDFKVFERYLKGEFNKPVKSMIRLLKQHKKLLEKNIKELDNTQTSVTELVPRLKTKSIILTDNLNLITVYISKLETSLI